MENIYHPYHIIDEGNLRYSVENEASKLRVAEHLCWTDATFATSSLNTGQSSPALDMILQRSEVSHERSR